MRWKRRRLQRLRKKLRLVAFASALVRERYSRERLTSVFTRRYPLLVRLLGASSNGRTPGFDPDNSGSSPEAPTTAGPL